MQKDVVYIDVDDDITAIIGKLKNSKHEVIALVPPKRVGVLQSAVNLRLLARAASQNKKHLVIVTSNHALSSLAASASIPVAKNLQSKPELAEVAVLSVDDGEDVIEGDELPIENSKPADKVDDDAKATLAALTVKDVKKAAPPADGVEPVAKVKSGPKVPNFDTFRKKLLLFGALGLLLISFLVWAIWFAPHARVLLTTRTTDAAINQPLTLGTEQTTDFAKTTLKAESRQVKKDVSIDYTASGKKDVGEKATGSVKLSKLTQENYTVPAGTVVSDQDSGLKYTTDAAVTIPASVPCFPSYCAQSVTVAVTAAESGSKYNAASGAASANGLNASFVGSTSGGTDKTITVVTQSDIDNAKQKIADQVKPDQAKTELSAQFGGDYTVLGDTLSSDIGGVNSSVAVDSEATNGKATLSGGVVFTILAVKHDQLSSYLDAAVSSQIDDKKEQKIYDNGLKSVKFANAQKNDNNYRVQLSTNGKVGPMIDEAKVKSIAKGKSYGEVQSQLDGITGVDNVDVKFSPFWVRSVPNDDKKITVEFVTNGS